MEKNAKVIWNNAEWTKQARNIIQGIKKFPKESKIFIFLRHSQREHSNEASVLDKLGLTDLGSQIASIFGENLPISRLLKIYHSHSPRCIQTAHKICDGFQQVGGICEIVGTASPVNKLKSKKGLITTQALKLGGNGFISRWYDKKYTEDEIVPFENYCVNVFNFIKSISEESQVGFICIHITHDIFILALRKGWFDLSTPHSWPSFLSGFAITFKKNPNLFLDLGKSLPAPILLWNGNTIPLFKIYKSGGEKYGKK